MLVLCLFLLRSFYSDIQFSLFTESTRVILIFLSRLILAHKQPEVITLFMFEWTCVCVYVNVDVWGASVLTVKLSPAACSMGICAMAGCSWLLWPDRAAACWAIAC